jgi:hypothetical protein
LDEILIIYERKYLSVWATFFSCSGPSIPPHTISPSNFDLFSHHTFYPFPSILSTRLSRKCDLGRWPTIGHIGHIHKRKEEDKEKEKASWRNGLDEWAFIHHLYGELAIHPPFLPLVGILLGIIIIHQIGHPPTNAHLTLKGRGVPDEQVNILPPMFPWRSPE